MSSIFRIEVLPAQRGDCLWIEYGDEDDPHRILIDGGIARTGRDVLVERLQQLGEVHFELLIVTHIDQDHIEGVLELLKRLPPGVTFDQIWFNGRAQLPLEPFGVKQGIELMDLLRAQYATIWNRAMNNEAVSVDADGKPTECILDSGMKLTVLSPDRNKLAELAVEWDKVLEEFEAIAEEEEQNPHIPGLIPQGPADEIDVDTLASDRFSEDEAPANGSSIAVLLEFDGKSALMLGDAHPTLVVSSLRRLSPNRPLQVDCVKLSHHGSRKNTNEALIRAIDCPRWILSSNGVSTRHPNQEAVARVLKFCPGEKQLFFNYRTSFNEMWDEPDLMDEHRYTAVYGDQDGVLVDLAR